MKETKDSARDNTYTVHDLYKISIAPRDRFKEKAKEWRSQGSQTNSGSENKSFYKPSERAQSSWKTNIAYEMNVAIATKALERIRS